MRELACRRKRDLSEVKFPMKVNPYSKSCLKQKLSSRSSLIPKKEMDLPQQSLQLLICCWGSSFLYGFSSLLTSIPFELESRVKSISRGQPLGTLPEIDVDSFEIDVTEPFVLHRLPQLYLAVRSAGSSMVCLQPGAGLNKNNRINKRVVTCQSGKVTLRDTVQPSGYS